MQVFLDGEFLPQERASIPVDDRCFLYGDGLFETVPVYGGTPFRWSGHMERLREGLKLLRLESPYVESELEKFAVQLVELNKAPDCVLRLTISRGSGPRGYSLKLARKPRVLMTVSPLPAVPAHGWRLVTSSLRVLADDPLMQSKTCSKLRSVLARAEAEEQGANEALLLNERGEIAEGAATNIFGIENGTVFTPPLGAGLLPGVTRAAVFELCLALGIRVCERVVQAADLARGEGVFMTVSTMGVVEAVALDGVELARSPLTRRLQEAYAALVRRETSRESHCAAGRVVV